MVAKTNIIVYSGGMSALQKVIEIKKSQGAVGAVVGQRQQSVVYWLKNRIPAEHVLKISADVNFVVTPHELRPDLYPYPDDGLPTDMRTSAPPLASAQVTG